MSTCVSSVRAEPLRQKFLRRESLNLELEMVSRVTELVSPSCSLFVADRLYIVHRRISLGSVHLSFRALCGRLKLTVRRHEFNEDSLSAVFNHLHVWLKYNNMTVCNRT
jgi:hypothetical protein